MKVLGTGGARVKGNDARSALAPAARGILFRFISGVHARCAAAVSNDNQARMKEVA
jgi:hypothetical protein